ALRPDLAQPPVVEAAPPPVTYEQPVDVGCWYIRGDIDYHWSRFGGGDYITYGAAPQIPGSFDSGKLKGAFSAGAGVGYQINQHFRTDLTGDWMF
ncbi:porin family protein, partial [Mesorhizobium sp. M8A.F.Ca.ET.213.01.1.1]